MTTSLTARQRLKVLLRPALAPLIRRLRLPFDVLVPRIESLEQRLATVTGDNSAQGLAENVKNLRGTVENLTRTWLRMQNEVARRSVTPAESTLQAMHTSIAEATVRIQAIETLIPEVQAALSRFEARQEEMERRWRDEFEARSRIIETSLRGALDSVELLRRESVTEARTAGLSRLPESRGRRHVNGSRIVSVDRVRAALSAGALRLNIGCGHEVQPDYINVDIRELAGVDVVADAAALPFEIGSVDEIAVTYVLEHFPQEHLRQLLLPYWRTLLKPGGRLTAVVSDSRAMLAGFADGTVDINELREALFGDQARDGGFHCNLLTPDGLVKLAEQAGFTDVEVPVHGRSNGRGFEFELVARAPLAASASPGAPIGFKRQVVA